MLLSNRLKILANVRLLSIKGFPMGVRCPGELQMLDIASVLAKGYAPGNCGQECHKRICE